MECNEVDRFSELNLDGETDPDTRAQLEVHFDRCPTCRGRHEARRRVVNALRTKLVSGAAVAETPVALRSRVAQRLRAESNREAGLGRVIALSVATAGVIVFAWGFGPGEPIVPEDAAQRHSRNLPPEVRAESDSAPVKKFLKRNLSYAVDVPQFQDPHVRLVGARLSNIQDRDAAYVMYDARGARISLFAYPKPALSARPVNFEERVVRGRPVLVGQHRGYNVVAWEDRELVYSLVSDVDASELIRLVSSTK